MEKRLAMNSEGQLTYCTASEENIGKGRCNHIAHQKPGEEPQEFLDRANGILEKSNKEKIGPNYNLSNPDTIKFFESNGIKISLLPSGAHKIDFPKNPDIQSLTLYTRDENYLMRFKENMHKTMMEYFDSGEYEDEKVQEWLTNLSDDPKVYITQLFNNHNSAAALRDTLYGAAASFGGWSESWEFEDEEGKTGLYMDSLPGAQERMEEDIDNGNISEYSTIWISNEESSNMINYLDKNF